MGSQGREDSRQRGGWRTQRGGGLWSGEGQAAASSPYKVGAGRPCGPTFAQINREGQTQSAGERGRQSGG